MTRPTTWARTSGSLRNNVFQNIQIVLIAFRTDKAVVDGLFYCAAGLMAVGAVGEAAVVEAGAHLGEEVRELLGGEVHHAELLDARSVD